LQSYAVTSCFWQFVDHWQTLIAGTAALLAALVTVCVLVTQIRQTGKLASDQRLRRARAARAVLPLALSELADYSTGCIKGLRNLRPYFRSDGSLDQSLASEAASAWRFPDVPESALSILKECIEFIDDAPAKAAAELIRHLQIQRTRLAENISRLRLNDGVHLLLWANIDQAMRDAAEVYARSMPLFVFSRGQTVDDFQVKRSQIRDALASASSFLDYDEIDALADKWEKEFALSRELEKQGNRSIGF
jgi:hypothetical protein